MPNSNSHIRGTDSTTMLMVKCCCAEHARQNAMAQGFDVIWRTEHIQRLDNTDVWLVAAERDDDRALDWYVETLAQSVGDNETPPEGGYSLGSLLFWT